MPKEVFLEDVIERVVRMSKMQLYNAIYPEFDPVYRVDPHNKSVLVMCAIFICWLHMSRLLICELLDSIYRAGIDFILCDKHQF